MKQRLFITMFSLSLGLQCSAFFMVQGETSTVPSLKTTDSATATAAEKEQQNKTAAWMVESNQVAKDFVDTIDKSQYEQSWTKGDQIFQHTISKADWTDALTKNRKPLGKVTSRHLKDQRPAMDPKGLPTGAYMVVEYDTSFEKAPSSGEVVTLRRGSDGSWRVLTYQVN